MRISSPAFGFMSCLSTSIGLLPHIFFLIILSISKVQPQSVIFLVVWTIGAKLFGEFIFWTGCIARMNKEEDLREWRSTLNSSLLSHSNVYISFFMMCIDSVMDAALMIMAFKTAIPAIWVLLSLLGCQALSSPIQGLLSDGFSQKKSLLFAYFVGFLAVVFISSVDEKTSEFSKLMVPVLCGKGLLGNLTVIARAAIAEVIKVETLKKA